ncbi:MAG TPA: hypothetical protein ACQGQX_07445, partial [Xylella taiwanensis]
DSKPIPCYARQANTATSAHSANIHHIKRSSSNDMSAASNLNVPAIGWRAKRHVDDALNGNLYTAIAATDNPVENKKLRSITLNRWRQRQYNRHDHQQRLAAPLLGWASRRTEVKLSTHTTQHRARSRRTAQFFYRKVFMADTELNF